MGGTREGGREGGGEGGRCVKEVERISDISSLHACDLCIHMYSEWRKAINDRMGLSVLPLVGIL